MNVVHDPLFDRVIDCLMPGVIVLDAENCTGHRNVRSGQGDMLPVRHVFAVGKNHEEGDGVHVPLGQG